MSAPRLAYVALIVRDAEAAARMLERDFGLHRTDCRAGSAARTVPVMTVGTTSLALFAPGDPLAQGHTRTGVHHIALVADDLAGTAAALDPPAASSAEKALAGTVRFPVAPASTAHVLTFISEALPIGRVASDLVERVDHLGVACTDNNAAVEVFTGRLGCRLEGTEMDSEFQVPVEHFVSDRYGTIVHTRPAQIVAALHAAFVTIGDCELEFIQELGTRGGRVQRERPGDTRQDQGAISRYIATRGPGLHHVAMKVTDIDASLARLEGAGYGLIDRQGRPGGRAARIGFLDPRSTGGVLLHLVDRREPEPAGARG